MKTVNSARVETSGKLLVFIYPSLENTDNPSQRVWYLGQGDESIALGLAILPTHEPSGNFRLGLYLERVHCAKQRRIAQQPRQLC